MKPDLNKHREEINDVLFSLREDAEMTLNRSWDCTTQKEIETKFTAQLNLIDDLLEKINKIE